MLDRTLKEFFKVLLMTVFIGFFIGAILFAVAILVAAVFSPGIIASEMDALLLVVCCWFIGLVIALLAIVTNFFGFGN